MIVSDKGHLGVVWTFSPLFLCNRSHLPLWMKFLRRGFVTVGFVFGGLVFRQMRGVRREPLPGYTVFQVPQAQNNQCTNAACLGWCVPNSSSKIVIDIQGLRELMFLRGLY